MERHANVSRFQARDIERLCTTLNCTRAHPPCSMHERGGRELIQRFRREQHVPFCALHAFRRGALHRPPATSIVGPHAPPPDTSAGSVGDGVGQGSCPAPRSSRWCGSRVRPGGGIRFVNPTRITLSQSHYLSMWARSFSFSLQTDSRMSVFGSSSSVTLMVNGFVYILGSSTVTLRSMWPKSRRWNRS